MDEILAQARALTLGFLHLIRHHSSEGLESWLKDVRASRIREFLTFARSIERDKAAIVAGLTLPYSTGPVEGTSLASNSSNDKRMAKPDFPTCNTASCRRPDHCGQDCNPLSPPNVSLREEMKKVCMSCISLE